MSNASQSPRLSWDWDAKWKRLPAHVASYRGLTIYAVQDSDAENPFEAWEGEPPTLVYQGRREGFSDYSDGALAAPLGAMNDRKIARNWRLIAHALGLTPAAVRQEIKERRADYGETAADTRRELFAVTLDDMRHGNGSDYLEALATLWRIAGCAAETWASNGYSQGAWASGLSVATPEWAKKVGAPRSSHAEQCRAAGKLWGAWAWGDVYGYIIADDSDDHLDACWGFYGSDFVESGLEEAAKEAADSIIAHRAKARQNKAAELIRARVPLALRPAILDAAAHA